MTEVGRQPWIVFGLLTTSQGVSTTVNAGSVLTSLLVFALLYGALAVADVYLLVKYARVEEPQLLSEAESTPSILSGSY
jgi:cytochrome d ubiquinol oxidase subunit I